MQTQLFQDRFGVLLYDGARGILELRWLAETEAMTDDDFKSWLDRYATEAVQHRAAFLLVDAQTFKHRPGEGTGPWREEHITPRYNQSGVKKFAFLFPAGAAPRREPAPEGLAQFPTGYFDSRQQIDQWFLL